MLLPTHGLEEPACDVPASGNERDEDASGVEEEEVCATCALGSEEGGRGSGLLRDDGAGAPETLEERSTLYGRASLEIRLGVSDASHQRRTRATRENVQLRGR